MLFIFETGVASFFWMKGMLFSLDFVWIGMDCMVVDLTPNVPVGEKGEFPTYTSSVTAAYNFEINSGEAEKYGVEVGASVRFSNVPGGACSD